MQNKKIEDLKNELYTTYFEPIGFIRSGTVETKCEKRITLYSEKFSKDIGDGLFEIVSFVYYKDCGVIKLEFDQGYFVPEVYTKTFDKNSVIYDINDKEHIIQIVIKTKSNIESSWPYLMDTSNFEEIKRDIVDIVKLQVLPCFDTIKTRQQLIEYEEKEQGKTYALAYMYGASGKISKASKIFGNDLKTSVEKFLSGNIYAKNGIPSIIHKMLELGLPVDKQLMEKFVPECINFFEGRDLPMKRIQKIDPEMYDVLTREY